MYEVKLKDDTTFTCKADETIIEAALRHSVYLEHSCLSGRCSSCKFKITEGETKTDNEEISLNDLDKESGYILTCVRKPTSNISLDAEDMGRYGLTRSRTIPAKVKEVIELAKDIRQITLRVPPNQKITFLEGQYVDVLWKGLKRSYSIANPSKESDITLIIKNYPEGKMSKYWFNQCCVNDLLRVEIPKGTFFLRNHTEKENLVFIATGTGIAPIISILKSVDNHSKIKKYKRVILLWGMRSRSEIFWKPKNEKVEFYPVLSREGLSKKYVQNTLEKLDLDFDKTVIYACGNNQMIKESKTISTNKGLNSEDFFSDAFVPSH